jgi:hypothetical protein
MAKKATSKSKQALKNRTKLEWVLLAILLLIAYLFLASRYSWWPSNNGDEKLGTAFYVVKRVPVAVSNTGATTTSTGGVSLPAGNGGSGGGSSSGGSQTAGGSGNGGGSGGGSSSSSSRILTFAAGVNTGDSKQEVSGAAGGLNENCAVVANITSLGKQEVCTYTQGDKIVTVTYLNDNVISASRSGF